MCSGISVGKRVRGICRTRTASEFRLLASQPTTSKRASRDLFRKRQGREVAHGYDLIAGGTPISSHTILMLSAAGVPSQALGQASAYEPQVLAAVSNFLTTRMRRASPANCSNSASQCDRLPSADKCRGDPASLPPCAHFCTTTSARSQPSTCSLLHCDLSASPHFRRPRS